MIIDGRILTPSDPKNWLVNYNERIFSQYVHLGGHGKVEDWSEITPEEKERLEKEWYPEPIEEITE